MTNSYKYLDHAEQIKERFTTKMTEINEHAKLNSETAAAIVAVVGGYANSFQDEHPIDLLGEFESLVQQAFSVSGRERELDLLTKRIGLSESKIYTLQEIGDFLGITRERVRQLEKQALERLACLIDGSDKKCKPSPRITNAFRQYKSSLREDRTILLEADICQVYKSLFAEVGEDDKEDNIKLLMASFDFEFVESKELTTKGFSKNCWLTDSALNAKNINSHQKVIVGLLQQTVTPITFFELVVLVKKKLKKALRAEDIRNILRTLEEIIEVNDHRVQVNIQHLKSIADRAYRVLWERNERMMSNEIVREINRQMILSYSRNRTNMRSLVSQLAVDKRFTSIGKRGWVLSAWKGYDPRSIVDLMTESISLKDAPTPVQKIISYVKDIQPDVKDSSIRSYLSQKNRFTQTSNTEYALAEWKIEPYKSSRKTREPKQATIRDEVRREVIKYLTASRSKAVPLRELLVYLEKATKANRRTLYAYISGMHEVLKEKTDSNKIVCRLLSASEANRDTELKKLIIEGESNTVEFKSTLRFNIKSQQNDEEIEHAWLKTIAAFLNTLGGHLLVGINDEGGLLDLKLDNFTSYDTLLQFVGSKIENQIGPQFIPFIKYEIEEIDGKHLLVFTVVKSTRPVFLKKGKTEELFYVRTGNASKNLKDAKLVEYVTNNF